MFRKISILFLISLVFPLSLSLAEKWECKDYKDRPLTQEQLDEILKVCNAQIEKDKKELTKKVSETRDVAYEIKKLDRQNKLSQAYINKKNIRLRQLSRSIDENKKDIKKLNENIKKLKKSLAKLLYKKYQYSNYSDVETIFSAKSLSQFYQNLELANFIQKKIYSQVEKVKKQKKELEYLVGALEERNALEKQLIEEKKEELAKIKKRQEYKKQLLGILKKEVGAKKILISSREKTRKAILARKFTVASGAKVTFGEAYNIIRPHKKQLGMDPAFILAILFQESGHRGKIGGNIGRCTYNQYNKYSKNKKVMSNSQIPNFLKIMKGLGKDPKKQKVSCPIPRDGAYGGAMGPAQFMPNTWMMVRKKAAKILGKRADEMSPFINRDAFIASAVLLKNNYYSRSCSNYVKKYSNIQSARTLRERCAAAMYYAGGNWYKYRMTYGQSVVNRANRFRRDIAVINNN